MNNDKKAPTLALLIDAENAQPTITEGLLAEVAKFGIPRVKRIYGDWTSPQMNGWKGMLLEHSIQPIQQFRYTTGKNASDSAMIIDAMDLLYSKRFDGFCIVSSDSDFTRLASRLREEGLFVLGFGEDKTPKAFVSACDKFVYTELLRPAQTQGDIPHEAPAPRSAQQLKSDTALVNLLRGAINDSSDELGWAHLGAVGSLIAQQKPDFDARTYGYQKLSELVRAVELFDVEGRPIGDGPHHALFVRDARAQVRKPKPKGAKQAAAEA